MPEWWCFYYSNRALPGTSNLSKNTLISWRVRVGLTMSLPRSGRYCWRKKQLGKEWTKSAEARAQQHRRSEMISISWETFRQWCLTPISYPTWLTRDKLTRRLTGTRNPHRALHTLFFWVAVVGTERKEETWLGKARDFLSLKSLETLNKAAYTYVYLQFLRRCLICQGSRLWMTGYLYD